MPRRRARALIARRLWELGQPEGTLTAGAIDELLARAGEGEAGLLAALSAALFVASTEDSAQVSPAHVRAAVPEREAFGPAPPARPRSRAAWLAGGLAACCVAGAVLLMRAPPPHPPHVSQRAPGRPAAVQKNPVRPPPEQVPLPRPSPALADLPARPPAQVILVVPAADRLAEARLGAIAGRLRQAGIAQVRTARVTEGAHLAANRVLYFFTQDIGLARQVAALLGSAGAARSSGNLWVPSLVVPPPGSEVRPPGSIEAYVGGDIR